MFPKPKPSCSLKASISSFLMCQSRVTISSLLNSKNTCSATRAPVLKAWSYQASLKMNKIHISAWNDQLTKVTDLCLVFIILFALSEAYNAFGHCLFLETPSFIPVTFSFIHSVCKFLALALPPSSL